MLQCLNGIHVKKKREGRGRGKEGSGEGKDGGNKDKVKQLKV